MKKLSAEEKITKAVAAAFLDELSVRMAVENNQTHLLLSYFKDADCVLKKPSNEKQNVPVDAIMSYIEKTIDIKIDFWTLLLTLLKLDYSVAVKYSFDHGRFISEIVVGCEFPNVENSVIQINLKDVKSEKVKRYKQIL